MKPLPFREVFKGNTACDTLEVNGHPYLFTNLRIDQTTIPKNYYKYDLRDECDGDACEIRKYILVNHWGTIIGPYELPLDETGSYYPTEEDLNYSITKVKDYLQEQEKTI
jgi:hypothetical protein